MRVKIAGTGAYLPPRVVDNEEIASRMGSSSEWIVAHTGIESRRVAGEDECASTMGAEAARRAMASAAVGPEDIGLIVVATTTPDYGSYPSTACIVQKLLGCRNAAAFDLSAACSGFVYGLEMTKGYLALHPRQKALVIGSEVISRTIDWSDRSVSMLFGDGAGAVVLAAEEGEEVSFSGSVLGADGEGAEFIMREAGLRRARCADPVHDKPGEVGFPCLLMDGHAVFAFAVRKLDEIVRRLCGEAGTLPSELDYVFAHQANARIIEAVSRRMKLPLERFYRRLKDVGNTSSASIPLCLDKAVREGVLRDGARIALAGFGSGLTWAGMLMQWPYL